VIYCGNPPAVYPDQTFILAPMNANNDPLDFPICLPFCRADRREGLFEPAGRQTGFFSSGRIKQVTKNRIATGYFHRIGALLFPLRSDVYVTGHDVVTPPQ